MIRSHERSRSPVHVPESYTLQLMQPASKTIPALPCVSMDETLEFWEGLGFEITYRQKAPNAYGVVARDGYELHLFGLKDLVPAENFSTCLVMVPEVEGLHAELSAAMRRALGRSPARGLPRISRFRPGQTRFTITDPNGSSVIYIKYGPEDEEKAQAYRDSNLTPLQRAVKLAERLSEYHLDDHSAAKALDNALKRTAGEATQDVLDALEARAELARAMDDVELAEKVESEALELRDGGAGRARSE